MGAFAQVHTRGRGKSSVEGSGRQTNFSEGGWSRSLSDFDGYRRGWGWKPGMHSWIMAVIDNAVEYRLIGTGLDEPISELSALLGAASGEDTREKFHYTI